jgi:hypothetical protein
LTFNYAGVDKIEILLGTMDEEILKSKVDTELCSPKDHNSLRMLSTVLRIIMMPGVLWSQEYGSEKMGKTQGAFKFVLKQLRGRPIRCQTLGQYKDRSLLMPRMLTSIWWVYQVVSHANIPRCTRLGQAGNFEQCTERYQKSQLK